MRDVRHDPNLERRRRGGGWTTERQLLRRLLKHANLLPDFGKSRRKELVLNLIHVRDFLHRLHLRRRHVVKQRILISTPAAKIVDQAGCEQGDSRRYSTS